MSHRYIRKLIIWKILKRIFIPIIKAVICIVNNISVTPCEFIAFRISYDIYIYIYIYAILSCNMQALPLYVYNLYATTQS